MPKYECSIYENRPLICKLYPIEKWTGDPTIGCSYYFEDGQMIGECSRCGTCCSFLFIDIHELGEKFVRGPCPYLKELYNDNHSNLY
jgi:Fe-S-cluster containining protein